MGRGEFMKEMKLCADNVWRDRRSLHEVLKFCNLINLLFPSSFFAGDTRRLPDVYARLCRAEQLLPVTYLNKTAFTAFKLQKKYALQTF